MNFLKTHVLATAIVCGATLPSMAAPQLAPLFGDHMVLQRGQKVPVWGTADPNEKITVLFAGQKRTAHADGSGRWMAVLNPLQESATGAELTVHGKDENAVVKLTDVLVGEVWLASGQSNMEYPVPHITDGKAEVAAANYPLLRFFTAKTVVAATPATQVEGQWEATTPDTAKHFSAVAYLFGRDLSKHLGVPVGIVHSSCSGTLAEAWTSPEVLRGVPELQPILQRYDAAVAGYPAVVAQYDDKVKVWTEAFLAAKAAGTKFTDPKPVHPADPATLTTRPGGLFNGKIAPLIPFAIKGVIWWQAEYNSERCEQYKKLFPALITDWRRQWGQGDFPFLFVQLQNFDIQPQPNPAHYDAMRDAQLFTYKTVPNTGMVVACDVGDAHDIHPPHKQPVAARLLLQAQALAYGEKIESSGPIYQGMKLEGKTVRLTFSHLGSGLVAKPGPNLSGFEVAGPDKVFHPATATLDGAAVVVTSPEVEAPVAVRYAWTDSPTPTLYNREDLPASPFRTDDWPVHTTGLR